MSSLERRIRYFLKQEGAMTTPQLARRMKQPWREIWEWLNANKDILVKLTDKGWVING